jgi:hypothetical protein
VVQEAANQVFGSGPSRVRRTLVLTLVFPAIAAAEEPKWREHRDVDGMKVELREVKGSAFEEIRVTTTSAEPLERLCEAIFGKDAPAKNEGNFKKREVLRETPTERWTYEQLALPVVSDRDYVIHVKVEQPPQTGRCEISFQTESDPTRPPVDGLVRIKSVRGYWWVTPSADGKHKVVYQVFSDPGGAVPPFLTWGAQRTAAVDLMKTILARARGPAPQPADAGQPR